MTFVLTIAIFKNGGHEIRKILKMVYLKSLSHRTYIHIPHLFLYMKQLLTYGEIKFGGHLKNVTGIFHVVQSLHVFLLARCFEFVILCDIFPTIGASRSGSDLDTLYLIHPV